MMAVTQMLNYHLLSVRSFQLLRGVVAMQLVKRDLQVQFFSIFFLFFVIALRLFLYLHALKEKKGKSKHAFRRHRKFITSAYFPTPAASSLYYKYICTQ